MTLLDSWTDPVNTGIFTTLNTFNVPWGSEQIADSLNTAYYYNHSGGKVISPLVSGVLGSETELTASMKETLAKAVYGICHKNWQYLWDAVFATYDPIENFNGVETETFKKTGTDTTGHTGTDTHTLSGTDTTTNQGTDTVAHSGTDKNENVTENGTSETKNQLYGYNSADPSNDSVSTTTVNQTVTNTETIDTSDKDTVDLSNATTYGRQDQERIDLSDSTTYNNTNTRELSRHGNLGVTTSQQMIESEIALRRHNFFEIVFDDIDRYLTIGIY